MFQDLVPLDTQVQFSNSRQHINILTNAVCKLRDIAERMVLRATSYAADMLQIGKELRYVMRLTHWHLGDFNEILDMLFSC